MKARLIYTTKCNRACEGCCNESLDMSAQKKAFFIDDLAHYDEIIITGGEPCLDVENLVRFARALRAQNNNVKLILQTAYWPKDRLAAESIIDVFHGVTYTLHANPTLDDIIRLKLLAKPMSHMYDCMIRVNIDVSVYNTHDLSNINMLSFAEVRKMRLKEDCPIPDGEELVVWDGDRR